MGRGRPTLPGSLGCALALLLAGCPAFHHRERDVDRTPTVDTGAGASIIYPGQTAPQVGTQVPSGPGATQRSGLPGSSSGAERGVPAPSGGGLTMIGGSATDEKKHQKIVESPIYWKYLTLPLAVVAAPFKYGADAIRGEPEPGPPVPSNAPAPAAPPGPPPVDYETARLEDMERELAQRGPPPRAVPVTTETSRTPPNRRLLSISEELAALRRPTSLAPTPSVSAPPPQPGTRPLSGPGAAPVIAAAPPPRHGASVDAPSGRVDRDGDGNTDHWIYRRDGRLTREAFDDDFDGRPDRILHYAPAGHEVVRIEEDSNQDGRLDSWTALEQGRVVRRRSDADDDGQVDTWSFYRNGEVTRLERDASGDGFRDHVAHYRSGRLTREEEDGNADGRPDLVKHYDANERVLRVEEDADGDGRFDVVSHYEDGRLKRRELLDTAVVEQDQETR